MIPPFEIEFPDELGAALANARCHLCAQRGSHSHWEGELSTSALSTAITICALAAFRESSTCSEAERNRLSSMCDRGVTWLATHQNDDGGWGDTTISFSNISTTALCWAAFAGRDEEFCTATTACEGWLRRAVAKSLSQAETTTIEPPKLAEAIRRRYGKDHTFSVPILTTLALKGRLGPPQQAWRLVPQLPFELAAFPHAWYAKLKLPVVSYALPALIAIGNVRFAHAPGWFLPHVWFRKLVRPRTLRVLAEIQPSSGGFLEASPLTSFVCLSLIGAGLVDHPVVERGLKFLTSSVRSDGSWAIDSDLATWVTTLSSCALEGNIYEPHAVRNWLLGQQYQVEHPYTHAAPGGWAWTDLPGGVPDADDTPGALLALAQLDDGSETVLDAAAAGVTWLLDLQNSDGGMPTFCRGWGKLPFDRSSADLTAHAIRAWLKWKDRLPRSLQIQSAIAHGLTFLQKTQRPDGAWSPLWFGNQHTVEEENLIYGTSRVLLAVAALESASELPRWFAEHGRRAFCLLVKNQHTDGGWGGDPQGSCSIEETALALEALCACLASPWFLQLEKDSDLKQCCERSISRGLATLLERTKVGTEFPPNPIGFYFAKLWYFEKLYPVIYSVSALQNAVKLASSTTTTIVPSAGAAR